MPEIKDNDNTSTSNASTNIPEQKINRLARIKSLNPNSSQTNSFGASSQESNSDSDDSDGKKSKTRRQNSNGESTSSESGYSSGTPEESVSDHGSMETDVVDTPRNNDNSHDNELSNGHVDTPMEDDEEGGNASMYQILPALKQPNLSNTLDLVLRFALHRYFTYPNSWSPPISSITKEDLANSGFFFTSDFLSIQCYFCNLEVNARIDWNSITTVDAKHRELNPNCPFMNGDDSCNNIPINDPTNYRYEAHRLYSLLISNWTYPVTPYDLAKYGFYWTGTADTCRCTFCRLEVSGWEEGDDACSEHRRWNPSCVFMNHRSVGNVPIGREISDDSVIQDVAGIHPPARSSFSINPFARAGIHEYGPIKYTTKQGPRPPVETIGVTPLNPAKHPEYTTLQSRLSSYTCWPMSLPQRPDDLAEAGFYYTSAGDRVICFQCGGGLKDWAESDTPWSEHAKWFSKCPYLLLKKGKSFVSDILKAEKIEMPIEQFIEAAENTLKNKAECVTGAGGKDGKEDECCASKEDESKAEPSSLLCKLCKKKDIQTVYLPCGHMVSCIDCVELEKECRTCKEPRVAYVRTFLQ